MSRAIRYLLYLLLLGAAAFAIYAAVADLPAPVAPVELEIDVGAG